MRRPIRRARNLFLLSLISVRGGPVPARAQQLPRVSITLMPGVPYKNVFCHYVLYGGFGAYGGFIQKQSSRTLQIPSVVEGKPVARIKMFIGAPRCRVATLDIPIQNLSDTQESFSCIPVPTIMLEGQIAGTLSLTPPSFLSRGTLSSGTGSKNMESWAIRPTGR
jgi:hypothetical protein